jgi:ketosteroid isomerase-like protein
MDAIGREQMLEALPTAIPQLFDPEVVWEEDPQRADRRAYRGHAGVQASFERWLEQWDEYSVELLELEDHGDRVLAIVRETGRGRASGADVSAINHAVFTFHDGKVVRYQEFYDEAEARAALA